MKIRCECGKLATWMYAPSDKDLYQCDDCVSRGCSCNFDLDGTEELDELGRRFPCCEYDCNEEGFDNDLPLNDSDKFDSDFYDD